MKYAIISTVSSDRFDYRMAADAAGQPRLAQFAAILIEDNGSQAAMDLLARPDGWAMSPEAEHETGVTADRLAAATASVDGIVLTYARLIEESYVLVAYGAPHHLKLMRGECRRAGIEDNYAATRSIDLMRALVDVCRIPNQGGKGFKLPKMTEALAHFRIEFPAVRDAVENARLSLGLFRALSDLGRLPAPSMPKED